MDFELIQIIIPITMSASPNEQLNFVHKQLEIYLQSKIIDEGIFANLRRMFQQIITFYRKTMDHEESYKCYAILTKVLQLRPINEKVLKNIQEFQKEIRTEEDILEIIFLIEEDDKNQVIQVVPILKSQSKIPSQLSSRRNSVDDHEINSIQKIQLTKNQSTPPMPWLKVKEQNELEVEKSEILKDTQSSQLTQSKKIYFQGISNQEQKQLAQYQNFEGSIQLQQQQQSISKLENTIKLFNQSHYEQEDMRTEQSYRTLLNCQGELKELNQEEQTIFRQKCPNFDAFSHQIVTTYNYLQKNLKELNSDGWTVDKESKGISVKYKFPPGSHTVSLLMESTIPVEALKMAALVNEIELYPVYVPFCTQASVLKPLNRSIKVCTSMMYFPVISNRETLFVGEAIDRLEEDGTFILMARSIQDDFEFQKQFDITVPKKTKAVRLQINFYIFEIKPLGRNSCRVRAVTNVDPKLSFVPQSLVAFIARKFAFQLFEKIVKYAKKFEMSPWYPKFKENKEFYDWVQNKIESFHLKQESYL